MTEMRELLAAQKKILSKKPYAMLFILSSVVFAWIFVFLTSIPGQNFESWLYSVRDITKVFVLLASPLMALILTTQVFILKKYRFNFHGTKAGGSALGAFLTGAIATACCSPFVAGALAFLGFAGASAFILQYEAEVSIIALAILFVSLYYSSKIVFCEECKVKAQGH